MSYDDAPVFSGPPGPLQSQRAYTPSGTGYAGSQNGQRSRPIEQEPTYFHGEALARDPWAEHYGSWIVLGFTAVFALFLIGMLLAGQAPGKSFLLKSVSDILQFVGEGIGFIFCLRITLRLRRVSLDLRRELLQKEAGQQGSNELAKARAEAQVAHRTYLAWMLLAFAIALYASGQAIWTSYDVRMNTADVPFPGLYDIGFVSSYPFFLVGTLLLTRRNKASVGRVRLILDALAVIGVSLALSWFFLLAPSIAGLAQTPDSGVAFLSIYFPTGDLFLVAVGAFLMFSPLSNRAQQPVFMLLCLGLFFLAVTDSLLGYYNLAGGFNTGTLQDVLWPLSLSLVGLAAVEYPRSVAHEQEQTERANDPTKALLAPSRFAQVTTTVQTISPFLLALMTCAVLLTIIAPHGGATLIQADVVALVLILIVVARQALTLIENNRLTMQMRGELVISRRELQVTRREADEATRTAQDKQVLEDGVATLRAIHARVARGDFSARAPTVHGPLLPIAISLNLMLDRLSALSQRGARYDHLAQECKMLQEAVERLGQGLPAISQQALQSTTDLRSTFLGLVYLQRLQESQSRRLESSLDSMNSLTRRLREALHEIRNSALFAELGQATFERMIVERVIREVDLLEQQQRTLLGQTRQSSNRFEQAMTATSQSDHMAPPQPRKQTDPLKPSWRTTGDMIQQEQVHQHNYKSNGHLPTGDIYQSNHNH
ncbi:MAG TPA: hypothetical protein VKR06_36760, partial [Ktedonosporobacter sp.]|nr:hypothetical protein [Ktedonosporobacter sp.]